VTINEGPLCTHAKSRHHDNLRALGNHPNVVPWEIDV